MKKLGFGFLGLFGAGPVLVIVGGLILVVVIIFAAAGSVTGWIFGGAEPNHIPSANQPPSGPINLWTPTPIPDKCFETPTPVAVTVAPGPGQTPANTPANGTPQVVYLPTPTPCPLEFFSTPDPNYPPVGQGGTGDFDIRQGKITMPQIQRILVKWPNANGSPNPLTSVAQRILDFQDQYGINGGFSLAWFAMESGICTTGISPSAIECGNIVWTPGGNCATHNVTPAHDFCGYANWSDAVEAWFKLLRGYYITNGLTTVSAIVHVYAPCSDNGGCDFTNHYINTVNELAVEWGFAPSVDPGSLNNNEPHGSPFNTGVGGYWVTQPFGCTDFPEFKDQGCATSTGGRAPWFHRGVDLVSKGDKMVKATIAGSVEYAGWGDDGFGNRVYIRNGPFLVIYPHLSRVLTGVGARVEWGQPIGVEGSTGYSTGDHLHYEIHVNNAWVDSTSYLNRP
jgi:hypothetical protein